MRFNVWNGLKIYAWIICIIYDSSNKYSLLYDIFTKKRKRFKSTKNPIAMKMYESFNFMEDEHTKKMEL